MPRRHSWTDRAACRGMDTDRFYPPRGVIGVPDDIAALCATCPVRTPCAAAALARPGEQGIWGGTSQAQRRRILRRERRAS